MSAVDASRNLPLANWPRSLARSRANIASLRSSVPPNFPRKPSVLTPTGEILHSTGFARILLPMADIPQLLTRIDEGDSAAAAELLPIVYNELRRLAAALLAGEKPGQTLQATALVHEAYLKLVGNDPSRPWPGKSYFFGAAAESMRRILVDRARRKSAAKRGGPEARRQPLDSDLADTAPPAEVISVHEALDQLQVQDSLAAELVKLHYFGGMSLEDAGQLLGMSRATAYRMWTYARTWLRAYLDDSTGSPPGLEKVPDSPAI